jgi:hypothetical protein
MAMDVEALFAIDMADFPESVWIRLEHALSVVRFSAGVLKSA